MKKLIVGIFIAIYFFSSICADTVSGIWYAIKHPQKTWRAYTIKKTLQKSIAIAKAEVVAMRDASTDELVQHYKNIFDVLRESAYVISKYPLSKDDAEFVMQHIAELIVPLSESLVVMILQHPELIFRKDIQEKIQQITLDAKPFIEQIILVIDNTLKKSINA